MPRSFGQRLYQCQQQVVQSLLPRNYNQEIYKNFLDAKKPPQVVSEIALAILFYKILTDLGWQCTNSLMAWGADNLSSNGIPSNEWHYSKNGRTIIVIFGEGIQTDVKKMPDLVITDSIKFFDLETVVLMSPEIYGLHQHTIESEYVDRVPTKLYNCFMAAPSAPRQAWLYELHRLSLLDKGNVSYRLADRSKPGLNDDLASKLKAFDQYQNDAVNKIFQKEHTELKPLMPYKNFNGTLEDAIIDSKVSVVIETEYNNPGQLFFTEKTFRAMLMPRPFMIFSSGEKTGALDYLRNIGFEVHDDLIDHSYDQILDPIPRMNTMIAQLERLKSLAFTDSLRNELAKRARKNTELINRFRTQLDSKYYQAVEKIKEIS